MKPKGVRRTLVASAVVLVATCTACNGNPSAAAKSAKPGPEESFEFILETFKRRVAETPVGFVVKSGSSRSSMVGTNEVSSELIAPTSPAEPYKAIITVTSRSSYSLRRTVEKSDDEAKNKDSKAPTDRRTGAERDIEILDPSLISTPEPAESKTVRPESPSADQMIARRPDEAVRNYELRYENGRWNLVTELDLETERAIKNAFDQALNTQ